MAQDLFKQLAGEIRELKKAQKLSGKQPKAVNRIAPRQMAFRELLRKERAKVDPKTLSRRDRKFRERIGRDTYDSAFNRFGPEVMERATKGWAKAQLERKRADLKKAEAFRAALRRAGRSEEEIARTVRRKPPIRRPSSIGVQFIPIRRGPSAGLYEKVLEGKRLGLYTRSEALKQIGKRRYERNIESLSNGLGITQREAQALYRDVRKKARADLARFKRTKAYKRLHPRQKRGYTNKRWERGSLNALAAMIDAYFMWA